MSAARKKKIKADPKQPTSFNFTAGTSSFKDDVAVKETQIDECHDTAKKRMFQTNWITLFSWLHYSEGDFMFCQLCSNAGKNNGLCRENKCNNYQKCTLHGQTSLKEYEHKA